jgi:hypothetical protein
VSDTWQYRIRVSGPDKDRWFERATAHRWGQRPYLYDWPMTWLHGKKRLPAKSTWFNVEVTRTAEHDEFLGNFGGVPRFCFENGPHKDIDGAPLFAGLDITVEIIGLSWLCDVPGNVYSYRDVYERGALVTTEKSRGAAIAKKYAPELVTKFPENEDT